MNTLSDFKSGKDLGVSVNPDVNSILHWAPEYKTIPGMLKSERRVDSVLNDSGKRYYIFLSRSIRGVKGQAAGEIHCNSFRLAQYGNLIY